MPHPKSIRSTHHVISAFLGGRIGEEMVKTGKNYLMPDGTSRQRLGKMGASLVRVGDKFRALKVQWMGNEKRENWADTVIHQLKRLTYASESEVKDIYISICAVATHADMARNRS